MTQLRRLIRGDDDALKGAVQERIDFGLIKSAARCAICVIVRVNPIVEKNVFAQKVGFFVRCAQNTPENRLLFPVGRLWETAKRKVLISVFFGVTAQIYVCNRKTA